MTKLFDILQELQPDDEPPPNKFTEAVGERVRAARNEMGLSQTELARATYRRRATISNIETGKSEATLLTLVRVADVLKKPLTYFLPHFIYDYMSSEELGRDDQELLIQFQRIRTEGLKRLAVNQVKAIANMKSRDFGEGISSGIADLEESNSEKDD